MVFSSSIAKSEILRCLRLIDRHRPKPKPIPPWRVHLWSFIGAFLGIAIVQILFTYSSYFHTYQNVPPLVGSLGATAVLIYGSIDSPLAQPRNVIIASLISSVVGVAISKMFLDINTPLTAYPTVQWVAGATAVAFTLVLMQVIKSVHPPCGATAVLAVTSDDVKAMGWYYIPVVLLSIAIMLVIALVIDNIERQYPAFWWSPSAPPKSNEPAGDIEVTNDRPTEISSVQSSETQTQNRIFNLDNMPPGLLDPEEEETLYRIYQKVYA
ncbi:HPP family-domain-containing protein [Dichotomocladium elegans]|nr:HPP family-domain-containing protein [Dichotomocladium elegans]